MYSRAPPGAEPDAAPPPGDAAQGSAPGNDDLARGSSERRRRAVRDKWALEEHLKTAENIRLWDDPGEAARNGKQFMDYVESHLLDVDE
jgi:hypothetical protein